MLDNVKIIFVNHGELDKYAQTVTVVIESTLMVSVLLSTKIVPHSKDQFVIHVNQDIILISRLYVLYYLKIVNLLI